MRRFNYLNLWKNERPDVVDTDSLCHDELTQLEQKIASHNFDRHIFQECFSTLQNFFEKGGKISHLSKFPNFVEFVIEAGDQMMELGAKASSRGTPMARMFWLGVFYEIKWQDKKSDANFYKLLVRFLKNIFNSGLNFGLCIRKKMMDHLLQKAPASFLQHKNFILSDLFNAKKA